MEGFNDGSYCATAGRENPLGAAAGAEPCSAHGNAAIHAQHSQCQSLGWLTPQEWQTHPEMLPHALQPHPASATLDASNSAQTELESLFTFFINFFQGS